MFGRKGGLGDSGTKAGTELDRTVVTWAGNQGSKGGGGVCTSLAVPPQPGPLRAVPSPGSSLLGVVTLSQTLHVQLDFKFDPWIPKKKFNLGMKLVKLEIGTQEAISREPRTKRPQIVHQVLGYRVNGERSDLSQISCWMLETPGSLI